MLLSLKTHMLNWLRTGMLLYSVMLTSTAFAESSINWQPPVDVSPKNGNAAGMQVAAIADGEAVAVWSWFNGTNYIIQSSLLRADGSWTEPTTLSNPETDAFFPQISVDSKGNAIAIWSQKNRRNFFVIQAANKPINNSWSPPFIISGDDSKGNASLPQIAFNQKGKAHAVWQKKLGSQSVIQYSTKPEATQMSNNWSNPKNLSPKMMGGSGAIHPQISVDPSGNLCVIWNNTSRQAIEVTTQIANKNWSNPEVISCPGFTVFSPQIACDSTGNSVAIWSAFNGNKWIIQSATHLLKGLWSAPVSVSVPEKDSSYPVLTIDNIGNATAAWETIEGDFSIIQTAFLPFGGSWSSPINLTANDQDAEEPRIVNGTNGRNIVIWKQSDGANFVIQAAIGELGTNWSSPTTLSLSGQDAVFPQIATDPFGNVTATWMRLDGINTIGQAASGVSIN